jgi:hypothetical protein
MLQDKLKLRAFMTYSKEYCFLTERFQSLLWAIILPAIFFSSQLFSSNPQFNFFGDLYQLYFPQFVEGYHLANNGTLTGIDFLTNNGASAYFLRPNIPAFYPIYQLLFLLFSFETIDALGKAYVFVLYIHSVLALYFSMRLGRRFFQLDNASSLLLGVLYFGAIAHAYPIPPFYFLASLFPLLLYFSLRSLQEASWWRLILYSFPYVLVFLSGYLPIDVNAVMLVLLFSIVYCWTKDNKENQFLIQLVRLLLPIGLAGIVVLPLYLAIVQYNQLVTGIPGGVWYAAHDLSYQSKDLFALISRSFAGTRPGSEAPHITLGLIPAFLLLIFYSQKNKFDITGVEAKLISISMLIFVFYLLLAFGQSSGLPDLFYFLVPGLGKMHLYGRYLPIASFFFYLSVAIIFKHIIKERAGLSTGRWLAGLIVLMFAVHGYGQFGERGSVNTQVLLVELMMVGFVLLSLSARQAFYSYVGVITLALLIHAANFNSYTNSFRPGGAPYQNTVVFSEVRQNLLGEYFKAHSSKALIKYADLTSSIEKLDGVMLNYPWMVQDKIKLSNYMGYELHTSVDRDFLTKFPYFGKINTPWLLRTGADFIIYDQSAWNIHSAELEQWVDKNVPEFDLQYGFKVAKLKDASGLVDYVPTRNDGDFDNGIVRVFNAKGTASVSGFETDFASRIRFKVDSDLPVTVQYLMFPNKMMELHIDGERADVALKDGLLEFSLPVGRHKIEYQYKNVLHHIFVVEYLLYLALLLGILGWRTWLVLPWLKIKKIVGGLRT